MKNVLSSSIFCLALCAATSAWADRNNQTPTEERVASNVSEAEIDNLVEQGFRMHDIEVVSTSPYRFTGSFVRNSGTYAKAWWWTADKSFAEIESFAKSRNARITDLEVYVVNGQRRFAATMIANTGADASGWWIFDNVSFKDLEIIADDLNARVYDIEVRETSQDRRYSGVLVSNSGSKKKGWLAFANRTAAELSALIASKKMRLVDIERAPSGRFSGVLESDSARWWYQTNRTWEEMNLAAGQFGARVLDVERRVVDGQSRFDYILINNCNALTIRMGDILRAGTDGVRGFYLRQIGGQTLGALLPDFQFYPASSIKVLEHFYYSYRMDALGMSPLTLVPIYSDHLNDTHPANGSTIVNNQILQTTLQQMMVNSNNQSTNALQDFAGNGNGVNGRTAINTFKQNFLGLGDSFRIHHKFGGLGEDNDPANVATLRNFGLLYEAASDGSVISDNGFTTFRANMLSEANNTGLRLGVNTVIQQEGQSLGMTAAQINQFTAQVLTCWKPGNWEGSRFVVNAGWVELPALDPRGRPSPCQYVVGAFIHDSANNTFGTAVSIPILAESMREEIRKALQTW